MNAGCYGAYVADVLRSVRVVTRAGEARVMTAGELGLSYRHTDLPADWVVTEATFAPPAGDAQALAARMAEQLAMRDATQPVKDRSGGLDLPQSGGLFLDRARR